MTNYQFLFICKILLLIARALARPRTDDWATYEALYKELRGM